MGTTTSHGSHSRIVLIKDVYDADILVKYCEEEIELLNGIIDHGRDFLFTYAGLRQVADKYLVQDRSSGKVYETPQFMYLLHCDDNICGLSKENQTRLCHPILHSDLKTQNQYTYTYYGRC